jgi:hypothetical protein
MDIITITIQYCCDDSRDTDSFCLRGFRATASLHLDEHWSIGLCCINQALNTTFGNLINVHNLHPHYRHRSPFYLR